MAITQDIRQRQSSMEHKHIWYEQMMNGADKINEARHTKYISGSAGTQEEMKLCRTNKT